MTSVSTHAPALVWHRLVIAVLGVAAILLCLLAAHSSTSDPRVAVGQPGAQSVEQLAATTLDRGAPSQIDERCSGVCAPAQMDVAVTCMLVVLFAGMFFVGPLPLVQWPFLRQVFASLAVTSAALRAPAPPSLCALSISRT